MPSNMGEQVNKFWHIIRVFMALPFMLIGFPIGFAKRAIEVGIFAGEKSLEVTGENCCKNNEKNPT